MVLFVLLALPLLVAVAAFILLQGITWKEFLLQVGAQVLVALVSSACVYCANTHDVEVWNGRVTNKAQVRVSCSHSYPCNCRQVCTGSGKDQSCSTVCDTCYEHSFDYNWEVYTSNGEEIAIARVDSQGVHTPPRWASTQVGEPTSVTHAYTNYIKASPDSLFRHQGSSAKYAGQIPTYPNGVYDYYRLDRFVSMGVAADVGAWNTALSDLNADVGAPRQANVVVVLTRQPRDWFYALQEAWIGGKKNDVILVIGVDADGKPAWAEVMAWTIDPLFKIKLRDDVLDEGVLTPKKVMDALRRNIMAYHKRKPMADFEYLRSAITPSPTEWFVTLFIGIAIAIGLAVTFQVHDVFGDEGRSWGRGYARPTRYKPPMKFTRPRLPWGR